MKRKRRQDEPERRRALAEINLIGQKSASQGARRRGCALFGVIPIAVVVFGTAAFWFAGH